MNDPHQDILAATRHWLTRAVIGLNLCPFAKGVHVKEQVRYAVSEAASLEDALDDLERELRALDAADPDAIDTTLLIYPRAFAEFAEFNDALQFADRLLRQLRLEGTLQIASFHPQYQFDGTEADDIENYTNRAPLSDPASAARGEHRPRGAGVSRRGRHLRAQSGDAAPPRPRRLARLDGGRRTRPRDGKYRRVTESRAHRPGRAPRAAQPCAAAACPLASGAKKRSFSSASPNIARISPRRSAGLRRGRFLYCAMISSFFIECSQPTSSVTLT